MSTAAHRRTTRLAPGFSIAGVTMIGLAAVVAVAWSSSSSSSPSTSPSASPSSLHPSSPTATATAVVPGPATRAAPVTISVPSIGVHAEVTALALPPDGRIPSPADPASVGWLSGGSAPGEIGTAVLVGHLDSDTGPAVFAQLSELSAGDDVVVQRHGKDAVRFEVSQVTRYSRTDPPEEAFGPSPVPELRLVTCDGPFLSGRYGGYRDNIVVSALPSEAGV